MTIHTPAGAPWCPLDEMVFLHTWKTLVRHAHEPPEILGGPYGLYTMLAWANDLTDLAHRLRTAANTAIRDADTRARRQGALPPLHRTPRRTSAALTRLNLRENLADAHEILTKLHQESP